MPSAHSRELHVWAITARRSKSMATYQRIDDRQSGRATSDLFDRLPPQNLEAEQGVLGSLLLDPELCDEVAMLLRPVDFYAPAHQALYTHLLAMHNDGLRIDATLLIERLRKHGDLEIVGDLGYLAEVADSVPTAANATYY